MQARSFPRAFILLGLLGAFVVGAMLSSAAAGSIAAAKLEKKSRVARIRHASAGKHAAVSTATARAQARIRADRARRNAEAAKRRAAEARRRAAAARETALLARVSRHGLSWPRIGMITSDFGQRRSGFHHGIDILCNPKGGEPIYAANRGRVVAAGAMPIYGNAVILEHPNHMRTLYGHLQGFKVRAGQTVKRGQMVGRCGTSGNSTAPHLHFEVYSWGRIINPSGALPRR